MLRFFTNAPSAYFLQPTSIRANVCIPSNTSARFHKLYSRCTQVLHKSSAILISVSCYIPSVPFHKEYTSSHQVLLKICTKICKKAPPVFTRNLISFHKKPRKHSLYPQVINMFCIACGFI